MKKLFSILLVCFLFIGCVAVPPIVEIASWIKTGADVISYIETDKTTTDHALSYVMNKDCSVFYLLESKAICYEEDEIWPPI
jgi:hypothetical protein